jgi:hypothetical protein
VIYPGSTPVGNATLVVANVLTCNKHSHRTQAAVGRGLAEVIRSSAACRATAAALLAHDQQ